MEEKNKQKKREEHVLQYLLKTQELQEKKRELYLDKQLHIEQNIFLKNMEQKEKKQSLYNKLFSKFTVSIENRKHKECEEQKKRQSIIQKMELIDYRIKDIQKKAEMEAIKKREEERLKLYEKNLSIERKNRLTQYKTLQKGEKLIEKDKKMEDLKNQKILLDKKRAEIDMQILREKDDIISKFQKIMEKKSEINPELIKKVFPDDEQLYKKVVNLKEKQLKCENKIKNKFGLYGTFQKNSTSLTKKFNNLNNKEVNNQNKGNISNLKTKAIDSTIKEEKSKNEETHDIQKDTKEENNNNNYTVTQDNKTQENKTEENKTQENKMQENVEEEKNKKEKKEIEIKNKIEEYKSNLQKDFEQLILEEKKKEDERVKKYEEEKDNELKLQLEKQNSIERAQVTEKINLAKEEMDKKIREFETKVTQS